MSRIGRLIPYVERSGSGSARARHVASPIGSIGSTVGSYFAEHLHIRIHAHTLDQLGAVIQAVVNSRSHGVLDLVLEDGVSPSGFTVTSLVNVLSSQTRGLGSRYSVDGDDCRRSVDGDAFSFVISGASHATVGIRSGHSCTIGQSVAALAFVGVFGSCNGEPRL
jgi:hypothetical protein